MAVFCEPVFDIWSQAQFSVESRGFCRSWLSEGFIGWEPGRNRKVPPDIDRYWDSGDRTEQ